MIATRRAALTLLTGGAGAAALAACHGKVNRRSDTHGLLNTEHLTRGFPALARRARPGRLNLAVLSLAGDHVWAADSDGLYPMGDVFMLPLAAAAFAQIDAGHLKLSEPVAIGDVQLSPPPSLIDATYRGPMTLPAVDLIALAVQHGDNTAADVIMSQIGGPGAVTAWLRDKGIEGVRVDRYAREVAVDRLGMASFRAEWRTAAAFAAARAGVAPAVRERAAQTYLADPRDTMNASGALSLLDRLSDGRLLTPASTRLLLGMMIHAADAQRGLATDSPANVRVAHKSGSSDTDLGLTPVTNDIGLMTFPDGHRLAVAVFLAGSTATDAERARLIADIGRMVFDAYR